MTNEEAIEVLKLEKYGGDIRFYANVNPVLESAISESGYFSNAIDIAINAIKMRIAKKPNDGKYCKLCSNCERKVYSFDSYCAFCGQK